MHVAYWSELLVHSESCGNTHMYQCSLQDFAIGGGGRGYIQSGMHLVISLLDAVTNMFWAPILVGLVVVINQKKGTVGTALPNRGVYCHYQGTLK